MYMYIYIYTHVCMYVCMYIYIYIYTYIYNKTVLHLRALGLRPLLQCGGAAGGRKNLFPTPPIPVCVSVFFVVLFHLCCSPLWCFLLSFVFLRFSSAWGSPEVGDGDNFFGIPGHPRKFFARRAQFVMTWQRPSRRVCLAHVYVSVYVYIYIYIYFFLSC